MNNRSRVPGTNIIALAIALSFVAADIARSQVPYNYGANVQPAFDGFEVNPDGTFTLWFAYLNRNYSEVVDVPIGPDNMFEPGPIDRGQPTRFHTRRHMSVFSVVVPKDFKTLTWHLTVRGQRASAIATPNVHNMIDRKRSTLGATLGLLPGEEANHAPTVAVQPQSLSLKPGEEGTVTISAKDDGLPKMGPKTLGMSYRVSLFRGKGEARFTPAAGRFQDGRAVVKASFDQPGEYRMHIRVDDGSGMSGTFCCWVNDFVKVTVK